MSDFTHARVCIHHASGSVEIQAPAGETTWLDLSGLHVLPVAASKNHRRKRPFLTAFLVLGCFAAVGTGIVLADSNHSSPTVSLADAAAALAAPQQPMPLAVPSIAHVPQGVPGPAPQPSAQGADPFGLRLK